MNLQTQTSPLKQTIPRRALLKRSVWGVAGLGTAWLLAACGRDEPRAEALERSGAATACTENDELSRLDLVRRQGVNYADHSPDAAQHCGNCRFFKPDGVRRGCGRCEIVPGRVAETGYCTAWSTKG